MKVKFVRYSMCICGFPLLKDAIPIGTIYEINEEIKSKFTWRCGGCHKINSVQGVWVYPRDGQPESFAGFLPEQIFEQIKYEEKPEGKNNEKNKTKKPAGE